MQQREDVRGEGHVSPPRDAPVRTWCGIGRLELEAGPDHGDVRAIEGTIGPTTPTLTLTLNPDNPNFKLSSLRSALVIASQSGISCMASCFLVEMMRQSPSRSILAVSYKNNKGRWILIREILLNGALKLVTFVL